MRVELRRESDLCRYDSPTCLLERLSPAKPPTRLRPKTRELLTYFIRRNKQLVPREVAQKEAWDGGCTLAAFNFQFSILRNLLPASFVSTIYKTGIQLNFDVVDLSSETAIAVLPFKSYAESDKGSGRGMAQELTGRLTRAPLLKVIPFHQVDGLYSPTADPMQLGRSLKADLVLIGTIEQDNSSGRLRVFTDLMKVLTGECVWMGKIARSGPDVFSIQDDIAVTVAEQICQHLDPIAKLGLLIRETTSEEAYH